MSSTGTSSQPINPAKPDKRSKSFKTLRAPIAADPSRRSRVDERKRVVLAELRHSLDLTQAAVADRLDVTQENVQLVGP